MDVVGQLDPQLPYPPGRRVRWGRRLRRAQRQSGRYGSRPRAPPIFYTGCDVLDTNQANSRRPSTVVARVRAKVSPCGFCGAQSGIDAVLPTTLVFLRHYHSTIHLTPSLYRLILANDSCRKLHNFHFLYDQCMFKMPESMAEDCVSRNMIIPRTDESLLGKTACVRIGRAVFSFRS